jgi:uncharacterized BrkB/YihY/UPF0761 family membrane protein
VIPTLLEGVLVVALWVYVQDHLPHQPEVTWRDQLPGAILVGVGAEALQLVTVFYFARSIETKSSTYGAIGAALAILLWAYILGRIIVSGAMLNAVVWDQKEADKARKAQAHAMRSSAPPRPEEHRDPRHHDGDEHGFDVEGEVGVEREQHQDGPAQ